MIGQDDFAKAIKECATRWPALEKQLDVYYKHLNFLDYQAFSMICHRFVEDFRSMPLPKDFKEAYAEWKRERPIERDSISGKSFDVKYGVNCRYCDRKNVMCISEPIGSDWQCRQCYTGLTSAQIIEKWENLIAIMNKQNDGVPF